MKCPYCGVNHRKINVANTCYCRISNEWAHYIILCMNMPGGITVENVKKYKGMSISNFLRVKDINEKMKKYIEILEKKNV